MVSRRVDFRFHNSSLAKALHDSVTRVTALKHGQPKNSAHERLPNLPGYSEIKRVRVVKLSFIETLARIVNSKIIDTDYQQIMAFM